MPNYVSAKVARERLGVSLKTLLRWEESGRIKTIHPPGGRRRYDLSSVLPVSAIDTPPVRNRGSVKKIVNLIGWQNGSPDYAAMNEELLGWFKYWCDRLKNRKVAKGDRISAIPVVAEFEGIEIEEWDDEF